MRLRSIIIFGAGYLLGSRAGRDHYNQVAERVKDTVESDLVQTYAAQARELAKRSAAAIPGAANVLPDASDGLSDSTETKPAKRAATPSKKSQKSQ